MVLCKANLSAIGRSCRRGQSGLRCQRALGAVHGCFRPEISVFLITERHSPRDGQLGGVGAVWVCQDLVRGVWCWAGGVFSLCGTRCKVPMSRGCDGGHKLCPSEGTGLGFGGGSGCARSPPLPWLLPLLHRLKTTTINQEPSPGLGKVLGTLHRSLSILNNNALELPAPRWLHLHDAKNQ